MARSTFILCCFLSLLTFWIVPNACKALPTFMTLHAPFTPFHNDSTYSLNTAVIPSLAKLAHGFGVNTLFVGGGLGQFDTMTVDERKSLATVLFYRLMMCYS